MAVLACRRLLLLTTPPTPSPPPLLSFSSGAHYTCYSVGLASPTSYSAPSSSEGAVAIASYDGRKGRISCVSPNSHHPDYKSHEGLLRLPTALLCRGPNNTRESQQRARGGGIAGISRKLWRGQATALNSVRLFDSGFSLPTTHIKSGRFHFMATVVGTQSNGFGTSSESRTGNPQKLVTFETHDGKSAVGIVRGDALWSLQDVLKSSNGQPLPEFGDVASVINNWSDLKDRLIVEGSGTKLSEVKLLAPIPRPTGVIMCIGKNYLDHVKEVDTWKTNPGISKPEAPQHPIVFTKAPQSVIGPGAVIRYPHGVSTAVDYEAELGVIIGKAGLNIKKEDAMSHIFGYTIINDVTARDVQKRHQQTRISAAGVLPGGLHLLGANVAKALPCQLTPKSNKLRYVTWNYSKKNSELSWFLGKSCDTFCPMGPGIVPASEIDGNDLQIQCWINDELRQNGRTSQMIFGIPELIECLSSAITLQPGDIIATGTPSGVGSGFDPPRHLRPGDKIRISIEGLGELCNTVE